MTRGEASLTGIGAGTGALRREIITATALYFVGAFYFPNESSIYLRNAVESLLVTIIDFLILSYDDATLLSSFTFIKLILLSHFFTRSTISSRFLILYQISNSRLYFNQRIKYFIY